MLNERDTSDLSPLYSRYFLPYSHVDSEFDVLNPFSVRFNDSGGWGGYMYDTEESKGVPGRCRLCLY